MTSHSSINASHAIKPWRRIPGNSPFSVQSASYLQLMKQSSSRHWHAAGVGIRPAVKFNFPPGGQKTGFSGIGFEFNSAWLTR